MIKLCIFDLDGTLLNTLENITYYVNKSMIKYTDKQFNENEMKKMIGNGAKRLIENSLEALGLSEPIEIVLGEYMRYYDSDPTYLVRPYDGIVNLLENLNKSGIKIAVLSNKPDSSTSAIVRQMFADNLIYKVFGQREGVPKKPDPTVVEEIRQGFGKEECVFIGDSKVDIQTGKNAGIRTIGVTWGFRDEDELQSAGADYIVHNPSEIFEIIKLV